MHVPIGHSYACMPMRRAQPWSPCVAARAGRLLQPNGCRHGCTMRMLGRSRHAQRPALQALRFIARDTLRARQVELCCRVAALLVRLHHAQLVATPGARGPLVALQRLLRARTGGLKDVLGFNMAGIEHLQRLLKERQRSV